MSTSNSQVKSEGLEYLLALTEILQPGVTQEIFEAHAPSAFQVGESVSALWDSPPQGSWVPLGSETRDL